MPAAVPFKGAVCATLCKPTVQGADVITYRSHDRKLYHYYRCPKCRQKLRVPRGRGRIQISCPRCGTQFIKKS